jgi:hypothetical protein
MTGSVPGNPSDTGSTAVLGAASTLSTTGQLLNILLCVSSQQFGMNFQADNGFPIAHGCVSCFV